MLGDVVMSSIIKILENIAKESGGKIRVVEVPPERRPTAESLAKLENEISAQLEANALMRHDSIFGTQKK